MGARWYRHVAACVLGVSVGCTPAEPPMPRDPASLRTIPLEWQAAQRRYALEAEGWRSFQPIQRSAGGDPLIVVLRLNGDGPIPDAVAVEDVQLVKGEEVWTPTADLEVRPAAGASTMEVVVRDGPRGWAPGDSVDVVARVRDGEATAYVRAPRFIIARVD